MDDGGDVLRLSKLRNSSFPNKWPRSSKTQSTTCSASARRMQTKSTSTSTPRRRPIRISAPSPTSSSADSPSSISPSSTAWLDSTCRTMAPVSILQVLLDLIPVIAYNDPNTDGAVIVQREVGDNLLVMTIFAMQIWSQLFIIVIQIYLGKYNLNALHLSDYLI